MKTLKTATLVVLLCITINSFSQSVNDTLSQNGYVFDRFIPGIVLLKNGNRENAPLNYDANAQAIAYIQDGQIMTLTNISDVDTVYIQEKEFIALKDKFYEIIIQTPLLLANYTCKPHPLTSTVDHNGTSLQNNDQVSGNISGAYINRKYKGNSYMEFQKEYSVKIKNALYKVNNEKQFRKAFPEKSDAIHEFVQTNKIDLNKEQEVIKLINFCLQ